MRKIWIERLTQFGFVGGSICLYLMLRLFSASDGPVSPDGKIMREGYGGDTQNYLMTVAVENEVGEFPMEISVTSQSYSKEEAEDVFELIMDGMEDRIRGENASLMEVNQDLNLPKSLEAYGGVRLRWYSSDSDRIDATGRLKAEVEEATIVPLRVQLSAGEYQADYEIAVRIIPQQKTGEEHLIEGLKEEIQRLDEEQRTSGYLQLPSEYEGKKLRFQTERSGDYAILPLLGILMAMIWPMRRQSAEQKKEKKREQELLFDYAEIVSKLMVFIGAGMTVRNAWERMVLDYEKGGQSETGEYRGKARKGKKPRAAYEEMRYTYYQIKNGVSESKAYQDFGRRCRLQPYLKLSSLLEQNRRTGTKDLRKILQIELADAFEVRKNLARRMGEEAGTKLLLPLFLMLGIVMVMIMVPAMMTMG